MMQFLFSTKGRIGRAGFWQGVLLVVVLTLAGGGVAAAYFAAVPHQVAADGGYHLEGAAAVPMVLVVFATILVAAAAGVCLAVKRFHDRDKSGWWILIQLVPIIGPLWYVVETGFLAGSAGANRFGPDPRRPAPALPVTAVAA